MGFWPRSPALARSMQREMKAASCQQPRMHSPHHPVTGLQPGPCYSGSFDCLQGEILGCCSQARHYTCGILPLVVVWSAWFNCQFCRSNLFLRKDCTWGRYSLVCVGGCFYRYLEKQQGEGQVLPPQYLLSDRRNSMRK